MWAGRTGQPNTQMGLAHMGTNGHMTGGQSFSTSLNLSLVDPLDVPHIQTKGCHVGGDSNLQGLRDGQGGSLLYMHATLSYGSRGFWVNLFRLLRGGLDMVVAGAHQHLLTGGWAIGAEEWDRAPWKSLYKPSASKPATANSTFWRPAVSRH